MLITKNTHNHTHTRFLADCTDANPSCSRWAYAGECENNRLWMLKNCRKSCNQCGGELDGVGATERYPSRERSSGNWRMIG